MTNFLLFFALLLLTILAYYFDDKRIISPPVIVNGSFAASSLFLLINTVYWDYQISFTTLSLIIISILAFNFGYFLISKSFNNAPNISYKNDCHISLSFPKRRMYFLAILYGLLVLTLYYIQQRNNAVSVDMGDSLASIIQANRYYLDETAQKSSFIKFMFLSYKIITYYFVYVIISQKICLNRVKNVWLTIVVSSIYLMCCTLTTSRVDVIYFAIFIIFILLYLGKYSYLRSNKKTKPLKVVFFVLVISLTAVLLFRLLGTLTGKSERYSAYDNLTTYLSGAIVCFDKYIVGASGIPSSYTPQLLTGINSLLSKLGINSNLSDGFVLPHQHWPHAAANIYTSLFPYYLRFGLIGLLFAEFFVGFIYSFVWYKFKNYSSSIAIILISANFSYVLVYYPIAERFLSQLFSLTALFEITMILILCNKKHRSDAPSKRISYIKGKRSNVLFDTLL